MDHGVADIGIVGKDTLMEANLPLYEMADLKFGKCRLCVAGYPAGRDKSLTSSVLRVATKYPEIAKSHYAGKGVSIECIKLNGSVELGPILGLSDVILDIVESGRTLVENGLEITEEVAQVSRAARGEPGEPEDQGGGAGAADRPHPSGGGGARMKIYRSSDIEAVEARLKRKAEADPAVVSAVRAIVADVRDRGDAALFDYTRRFDGFELTADNVRVTKDEIQAVYAQVPPELLDVLRKSAANIAAFHELQKRGDYERCMDGAVTGRLVLPMRRAGVYVPGRQGGVSVQAC